MTRGRLALVIRLLCALALTVAALPVGASGMACAKPTPVPVAMAKALCAMPCCAAKAMDAPAICCSKAEHAVTTLHAFAKADDACACKIESGPTAPSREDEAIASGFSLPAVVLPASEPIAFPVFQAIVQPGIVGLDSGPPPGGVFASDRGRAPPRA